MGVYEINKIYANRISEDEESGLVEAELKISLSACDWYRFQQKPFYRELIQFLDNVEIGK